MTGQSLLFSAALDRGVDSPTDHKDYLHRSAFHYLPVNLVLSITCTTKLQTSEKELNSRACVIPKSFGVKPN